MSQVVTLWYWKKTAARQAEKSVSSFPDAMVKAVQPHQATNMLQHFDSCHSSRSL